MHASQKTQGHLRTYQRTELSKQVTQLQFPLSLALLKLKQKPLQQPQPTNDNRAA